jgi:branched-chain amino acid transport system permease protein
VKRSAGYGADPRIRWTEWLPWVAALAAFFLLPEYLSLGARILTYILFALSLDLIIGYAGIVTLGHSAFFGLGAYTAGVLAAKLRLTDPIVLLLAAAVAAGVLGIVTGAVILRTRGLTQLMLTLAIAAVCLEIANKATPLTGGADGLSGVTIAPIFGLFRFDLFGKTAYLWCLVMLFAIWWLVRHLIYSPFGAGLTGIRENTVRMHAIGVPVYRRLLTVYTLAATIAGIAGALLTQTNQFVGLNVLGFEPSGELLVMLILGGVGRLYGAFVGPLVYLIAQDVLAKQFPQYWYLGIGLILVLVVLFARGGLLGIADTLGARVWRTPRRRAGACPPPSHDAGSHLTP